MILRGPDRWKLAAVGAIFVIAGAVKTVDGRVAVGLVAREFSSVEFAHAAVSLLAGAETALGVLLLLRPTRGLAWASAGALAAMGAWMVYLDLTLGMQTPCGCGIPFLGEKGWAPLARNAALLGLCLWALRRGGGRREG